MIFPGITETGYRKPNAARPASAGDENANRPADEDCSEIEQDAVSWLSSVQSAIHRPGNGVPCNTGSTIETSHADLPGGSSFSAARFGGRMTH